jgi:tRNA(Ile)-lysidine synthase
VNWIQLKTKLLRSFSSDGRYLVGVSGGRDSVVLLHWLISAGYRDLVVCHLNHRLRGQSSDADARFVEKLVQRYNQNLVGQAFRLPRPKTGKQKARLTKAAARIDIETGSANVRALAKKKRFSIETAARDARYAYFARIARRRRCRTIFLAHHADDLVETFLINLFRGAGTAGLAAIREISTRRIDEIELTIVRPFLHVWQEEINTYVRKHGLTFREDASNQNLDPLRNRIRHRIIPYLEKTLSRNIRSTIWRTAAIASEERHWMERHAVPLQRVSVTDVTQNCRFLLVDKLRQMPIALQRRAILQWLRMQNIVGIGFDVIERVRSLAQREAHTAKVNLPQDRHARRRAGRIFIE